MTPSEARTIIESLADGRCPRTGAPLDGVLQEADVVRALFVAARALEGVEQTAPQRQPLPDNTGKPWTVTEERQLCEEFDGGKTVPEIATMHHRTRSGIRTRLVRLGKLLPDAE
jgi:hypothetical protein